MPYTITNPQEVHIVYSSTGSVQLPELSEGSDNLTVTLDVDFNGMRHYSDTIYFFVKTSTQSPTAIQPVQGDSDVPIHLPSGVTVLFPGNRTYNYTISTLSYNFACGIGIWLTR